VHTPFALEILAHDRIQQTLAQAAHDALVAQLPQSPVPWTRLASRFTLRLAAPLRLRLAAGLHGLAYRLDPCLSSESNLRIAQSHTTSR
jgi:hypothetical protein